MNSRSVSLRNETLRAAVRPSSETSVRRKRGSPTARARSAASAAGSVGISSIRGRISIHSSSGTQRNEVTCARLFTSRTSGSFAMRSLTRRSADRFSLVKTSAVSIAITKTSSSPKSRTAARYSSFAGSCAGSIGSVDGSIVRRRPGGSRRTSAKSEAPVSSATTARTRRACATTACGRQAQKTRPALSSTPATSAKSWCGESIGRFDSCGGFPGVCLPGSRDSRGWRANRLAACAPPGAGRVAARGLLLSAWRASPRVSLAGACRLHRTVASKGGSR